VNAGRFERFDLIRGGSLAAGDDGTGVSHPTTGWCGDPGDKRNHGFRLRTLQTHRDSSAEISFSPHSFKRLRNPFKGWTQVAAKSPQTTLILLGTRVKHRTRLKSKKATNRVVLLDVFGCLFLSLTTDFADKNDTCKQNKGLTVTPLLIPLRGTAARWGN
jgi:hypothetical protein